MFNLILLLLSIFLSKEKYLTKLNRDSEVKLTIKGKCSQYFIQAYPTHPDYFRTTHEKIYINGQEEITFFYHTFTEEVNEVRVIFKNDIISTGYMFHNLNNITRIDLSQFDSSKVTYMVGMFNGCTSLTSIDLTNFDISSSGEIRLMFSNCSSLISVNLESFDTKSILIWHLCFLIVVL